VNPKTKQKQLQLLAPLAGFTQQPALVVGFARVKGAMRIVTKKVLRFKFNGSWKRLAIPVSGAAARH
jgi:hypothetical protein